MTRATSLQQRFGGFGRDRRPREQSDGHERSQAGRFRRNLRLAGQARILSKFVDGSPSWALRARRVSNVRRYAARVAGGQCTIPPANVTCARSQASHGHGATARDMVHCSGRNNRGSASRWVAARENRCTFPAMREHGGPPTALQQVSAVFHSCSKPSSRTRRTCDHSVSRSKMIMTLACMQITEFADMLKRAEPGRHGPLGMHNVDLPAKKA